MKDKIESFVSKKLIALVVGVAALAYLGESEMVKQLVMTFLGAQGAVDAVKAWKSKLTKTIGGES